MTAEIHLSILDRIQIASPCTMQWEDMKGDDRRRYCEDCSLHVHNISEMTRPQAERFLMESLGPDAKPGGRVCGVFYRRADGTIITRDCPVGLAALREKARRTVSRVLAAVVLSGASAMAWATRSPDASIRQLQPFATLLAWLTPAPPMPLPGGLRALGDVCVPAPPARPASNTSGPSAGIKAGELSFTGGR